ncbi:S-methyl-5-thioribose kinase, partial [Enterocloster bolteae]|nr:S-methyl-5-thioribose kinase [Enterocloster bolteae]
KTGPDPSASSSDLLLSSVNSPDAYDMVRGKLHKSANAFTFPGFAEDVSTFMVNTLLLSSDVVMDHKEKKELVKKFISPDLCDITEKLVLMEPYMDLYDRNN